MSQINNSSNYFTTVFYFLRSTYFLAITGLILLSPLLVSAHTRWFAEGEIAPHVTSEPTGLYLFVISLIGLFIIGAAVVVERQGVLSLSFLHPTGPHVFARAAATFTMVAGAFFMIAGTHEYLFSPNLTSESGVPMVVIMSQFAIGLMFLLGVFARVGALLLGLLWVVGLYFSGTEAMIEDIWVLSIVFFILTIGNDYFRIISMRAIKPFTYGLKKYALGVLRIGTGVTLLTLGFSEKILRPELGINFLAQHDWNFMSGFGFSDYLFVLSAGSVEALLGILLILGVMTRLTALVIAIIFITPLFILGPIELTGHLPHFVAVFVILLFGAGEHFRILSSIKKDN